MNETSIRRSVLKQSSSRSLLAQPATAAAEGTSPKVRWHQNLNSDDKEEEEEEEKVETKSLINPEEVLEKQDIEVTITYHIIIPGEDTECCTGNGIMALRGRTGQHGLFGPLFNFFCAIFCVPTRYIIQIWKMPQNISISNTLVIGYCD